MQGKFSRLHGKDGVQVQTKNKMHLMERYHINSISSEFIQYIHYLCLCMCVCVYV